MYGKTVHVIVIGMTIMEYIIIAHANIVIITMITSLVGDIN